MADNTIVHAWEDPFPADQDADVAIDSNQVSGTHLLADQDVLAQPTAIIELDQ